MKITVIVPMKLNNRRLPQKNTKCFTNGKPLCFYILKTLLSIKAIDEVYVYCSNEEIKNYIPDGVKFLKRSIELDTDSTKIKAFSNDVPSDIYVMTHTTAPFVKADSIMNGLNKVLSGDYDSAFAVKKLQDFLWKDGKPFNYELENIPRTQDLPPLFDVVESAKDDGSYKKSQMIMDIKKSYSSDCKYYMVGDTNGDYEAAKKAEVEFIGVTYGFGFRAECNKTEFCIKNIRGVLYV